MTAIQSVRTNMQQVNQYPVQQQYQYYPEIKNVQEFPDHYVYTIKGEASTGKKWGVGLASAFLTGSGQAINGQWGKAAGFFGGAIGAGMLMKQNKILGSIVATGVGIWSIVDAVKNASSDVKQIVPKNQINMQG